jgi:hypothetical protein
MVVEVVVPAVIYEPYRNMPHQDGWSTDAGEIEPLVSAGACASVSGGCRLCVVGGGWEGGGLVYIESWTAGRSTMVMGRDNGRVDNSG